MDDCLFMYACVCVEKKTKNQKNQKKKSFKKIALNEFEWMNGLVNVWFW